MTGAADVIFLVCSDNAQTKRLVASLSAACEYVHVPLATQIAHAMRMLERLSPRVIVLDSSALETLPARALKQAVGKFARNAPVVVVAQSQHVKKFASLEIAGTIEVVASSGEIARVVSRMASQDRLPIAQTKCSDSYLYSENFGELLRHEINNPLTGILGNAELLLEKRDRLPAQAAAQLQTIAQLAIRLRETVRRLSDTWETARHHARTI
jgi:signal transduction histidine kinase